MIFGSHERRTLESLGYRQADYDGNVMRRLLPEGGEWLLVEVQMLALRPHLRLCLSTIFDRPQGGLVKLSISCHSFDQVRVVEQQLLQVFHLLDGIPWDGEKPGPLTRIAGVQ